MLELGKKVIRFRLGIFSEGERIEGNRIKGEKNIWRKDGREWELYGTEYRSLCGEGEDHNRSG